MSSLSARPDSNLTRTQLRLVVLGQWVQAGLVLARGAGAGRGLIGGAVTLWRVFQAVRLAILLAQRLSQARSALAFAAPDETSDTAPGETDVPGWDPLFEDPTCDAAFFRHALLELERTIRDALGLAPARCGQSGAGQAGAGRSGADMAASPMAKPDIPLALGRLQPPRGRPPDRPPPPREDRLARRRRRCVPRALNTFQPPIAAPAIGRFRLAAG